MSNFAPEKYHEYLRSITEQSLSFKKDNDYLSWKKEVDLKLRELLGRVPEKVPANLKIEFEQEHDLFLEKRFVFTSETYADVPCHLLIPKKGKAPFPLVICLQGHSTGMHISLGRPKYDGDAEDIKGDRDFAIQAVKEGYAALVIEQRCFGERKDMRPKEIHPFHAGCTHASINSIMLGRTMIGERVWDISRAIDVLSEFDEIDINKIGCMGNSGGGTITYYAACLDERIRIAMPSCAVCTFESSIAKMDHCIDNYIPRALEYFEMGDLACLIAPRTLIVVAGKKDYIFPIKGVKENFNKIKEIYTAAGAPENCKLVVGEEGHQFYAKEGWTAFREAIDW